MNLDHDNPPKDVIYRVFKADGTLRKWTNGDLGFRKTLQRAKEFAQGGKAGYPGLRRENYEVWVFHIGKTEENCTYFRPQLVYTHIPCKS